VCRCVDSLRKDSMLPSKIDLYYNVVTNLTNIIPHKAFTRTDPMSAKEIEGLTVFLACMGTASVKAYSKTLVKLTP